MTQAVGLVGWRGMVGSVLMQRMRDEGDFPFFSRCFSRLAMLAAQLPRGLTALALCRTPTILTL